jgi:hypothetical protein
MYKYSKLVKEEFFKDKFLAFYWLVFRSQVSKESIINDQTTEETENNLNKVAKVRPKDITPEEK